MEMAPQCRKPIAPVRPGCQTSGYSKEARSVPDVPRQVGERVMETFATEVAHSAPEPGGIETLRGRGETDGPVGQITYGRRCVMIRRLVNKVLIDFVAEQDGFAPLNKVSENL